MLNSLLSDDNDNNSTSDDTIYKTKIDLSLRVPSSATPSILLLFLPDLNTPSITMNIDIGPNGKISVPDTSGIWENAQSKPSAEQVEDLHGKLARVLEISEDLGVVVEWTLRWIRKRRERS